MKKLILKLELPKENPFTIDEDSFYEKAGTNKIKHKFLAVHYADNYMFIEFEIKQSPLPASSFIK